MTKKQCLLLALAVLGLGLVLYVNRDWFSKPPIQITHRFHAFADSFARDPGTVPVLFEFNRRLKLTSVSVVNLAAFQTNRQTLPLWQLKSDSSSAPTKGFLYGMAIPGMRPVRQGSVAEAPEVGVQYRLLVEARSLKAHYDFTIELPRQ